MNSYACGCQASLVGMHDGIVNLCCVPPPPPIALCTRLTVCLSA